MVIIICNTNQQKYFEQLIGTFVDDQSKMKYTFVCDDEELNTILLSLKTKVQQVIIEAELNWDENMLEPFYGFNIATKLRRAYLVKAPIIICSSLQKSEFQSLANFDSKYDFLDAKGTGFLTFPFSIKKFTQQALEIEILNDADLYEVIVKHCSLQKEWQLIFHKIGNIIADNQNQNKEIQRLVNDLAESINRFAPNQKDNLRIFQNLLKLAPDLVTGTDLKKALENLDDGLQDTLSTSGNAFRIDLTSEFPKCPPKGFSKILIADDTLQTSLINSLQNEYRYTVIEQATKLFKAKHLLEKEKPNVVLSDLYFKRSERKTEIPDKSVGNEFIQFALTHPQYKNSNPSKPIVLVISKAALRSESEIRAGAINCSGAFRATNPAYIHSVIWSAAKERGVFEPEKISGINWTLEYTCRERLEPYQTDLPKLIRQWGDFKNTVGDTLRLSHLLLQSKGLTERVIVQELVGILQPYKTNEDYSFKEVIDIFVEVDRIHQAAKILPESETKRIRNILHGKIEQFSSVTDPIEFMRLVFSDVAFDLISIPQYLKAGQKLKHSLSNFSRTAPLLPFLKALNNTLGKVLEELPLLPDADNTAKAMTGNRQVNIIVAEDNHFWSEFVAGAIEKTKFKLGNAYTLNISFFDNAADALAHVPVIKQSHAIAGDEQADIQTIAIVDICMPENKAHADLVRSALSGENSEFSSPDSAYGLSLIRDLCSYKYNIPLVVFSTIDSIEDRKTICGWGVPENSFISKGSNVEDALIQALIRFIENSNKYVVKRLEDKSGNFVFRINGIKIQFPPELDETFSAIYSLCQTTERNEFSVAKIVETRGDLFSDELKTIIQDQIYRIRKLIFETLQSNRVYINAREFIKTKKSSDGDEFTYQLNAEVMSIDEEEDYESDVEIFENDTCRVLVIENDPELLGQIIEPLKNSGFDVDYATNAEDAVQKAIEFRPDIFSLNLQIPLTRKKSSKKNIDSFPGFDIWSRIRLTLTDKSIGVVVPVADTTNNYVAARATQMEIPISNLVSRNEPDWINLFLKKINDERRRVFLGEVSDTSADINEPIVEILDGSILSKGALNLIVNDKHFTMNISPLAKTIGLLLVNPKKQVSFDVIKKNIGNNAAVTENDTKNWTRRIRQIIRENWLNPHNDSELRALAEKILESSSSKGLKLNVQVFDSRLNKDI